MSDDSLRSVELLEELAAAAAPELPPGDLEEVRHFIEVDEYRLALESLIFSYRERNACPSPSVVTKVQDTARWMGIDIEADLRRWGGATRN